MTMVNAVLPTVASVVLFWGALRLFHAPPTPTAGTFVAFHAACGRFIGGAMSLSNILLDLSEVTTLWKRLCPIVITTSEGDIGQVDPSQLTGRVAFLARPRHF